MRILLGLVVIFLTSCVSKPSQEITKKTEEKSIQKTENQVKVSADRSWDNSTLELLKIKGYFPKFLKDGTGIIYSSSNYTGLKKYNFKTGEDIQLTEARGAGYDPVVLSHQIIYEVKSRKTHLEKIDLVTLESERIKILREEAIPGMCSKLSADLNGIEIFSDGKMTSKISPGKFSNYISSEVSPDGSKILFEVSGKGGYISDLNGAIIIELGDLDQPTWISNNEVLYAMTRDDGMKTTNSQLFIRNLISDKITKIGTDFSSDLFNPQSDSSGNMITANSASGEIVVISKR